MYVKSRICSFCTYKAHKSMRVILYYIILYYIILYYIILYYIILYYIILCTNRGTKKGREVRARLFQVTVGFPSSAKYSDTICFIQIYSNTCNRDTVNSPEKYAIIRINQSMDVFFRVATILLKMLSIGIFCP